MLLTIETATRRYLARRADIDRIALHAPAGQDERGRPLIAHELGPLLDPADPPAGGRLHALTVVLRRRSVALLVRRVDTAEPPPATQPLAALLARRLAQPWAIGTAVVADQPIILLDMRRIAADLALGVGLSSH